LTGGVVQLLADPLPFAGGDLQHLPLQPLAIGDVAGDPGELAPIPVLELADGQVHGEGRAVLAAAADLAADANDPLLPGLQVALEVRIVFVAVGRGHEDRDVLPDDLRGGVAEDPLGGRVERLDGPLLVDGDDAIHGGVDDRPDPVPALEQLLLHLLQRGDVGERDHHPLDPVLLGAVRQHLADVPQVLVVRISLVAVTSDSRTASASDTRSGSANFFTRSPSGRPTSVGIRLNSLVAAGVNRLMQNRRSRKIVAMLVLANKLFRSLAIAVDSSNLAWSWLLSVVNSSLSDCISSFEVSSSSLVDWYSSFNDSISSLTAWRSSLAASSSPMLPWRFSRVTFSSSSSRRTSSSSTLAAPGLGAGGAGGPGRSAKATSSRPAASRGTVMGVTAMSTVWHSSPRWTRTAVSVTDRPSRAAVSKAARSLLRRSRWAHASRSWVGTPVGGRR